jgi:hypothetical protein
MPDLIWHPVPTWIPAFAGMTILRYLIAGVITPHVSISYVGSGRIQWAFTGKRFNSGVDLAL